MLHILNEKYSSEKYDRGICVTKIKFVRVDERLIHGQVLNKWIAFAGCKRLFIIDDEVYEEPIIRKVLLMALPKDISLKFYDVNKGAEVLKSETLNEEVIILFKNLTTLYRIIESEIMIHEVSIATLPYKKEKLEILNNLYISKEEMKLIQKLINKGINLIVQMVPDSVPICLNEIIKEDKINERK